MNNNKQAFTLIEVMVATMLSIIVIMGIGALMVGMFRQQQVFSRTSEMQGEEQIIDFAIRNEARKSKIGGLTRISDTQFAFEQQDGSTSTFFVRDYKEIGGVKYYSLIMGRNGSEAVLSNAITKFSVEDQYMEIKGLKVSYSLDDVDSPFRDMRDLYIGGGRNNMATDLSAQNLLENAPN